MRASRHLLPTIAGWGASGKPGFEVSSWPAHGAAKTDGSWEATTALEPEDVGTADAEQIRDFFGRQGESLRAVIIHGH